MHTYRLEDGQVWEEPREIRVAAGVDVIVAGGGPAGLGAAVAAAREGASTVLIERHGFLGGTATAAMMTTFNCPLDHMSGFARDMVSRLLQEGGAWEGPTIPFDPEAFKTVALSVVQEVGVKLRLYSWVVDPVVAEGRMRGVVLESKSGREAILGKVVVDATGDADVAARAGAEVVKGRESDGKMRPMTILFRMGGVDIERVVEYARAHPDQFTADPNFNVLDLQRGVVRISGFFDHVAEARERGELDQHCHYIRFEGVNVERGTVFVNSTRVYGVDGTDAWDLTRAEIEARNQMKRLVAFIQHRLPGCGSAHVIDASSSIGVRETRRIRGPFVLREEDILAQRTYPDTVAKIWRYHAAGRDWHSPDGGEGSPSNLVYRTVVTPLNWFEIPYRCFLPNHVAGLLVGGRTLSQTHQADMWTRGMYCCLVTGQVAGTAAALAARFGLTPGAVDVRALQARLEAQGVALGSQSGSVEASARQGGGGR